MDVATYTALSFLSMLVLYRNYNLYALCVCDGLSMAAPSKWPWSNTCHIKGLCKEELCSQSKRPDGSLYLCTVERA